PLLRELARLTGRAPQQDAEKVRQVETAWRTAGAPRLSDFTLGPKLERASLPFTAPRRRGVLGWLASPRPLAAASISIAIAAIAVWAQQDSRQPQLTADDHEIVATAVDPGALGEPNAPLQ